MPAKHVSHKPKPRIYTGIGSRSTPPEILEMIERFAARMAERDWTLRSGHAPGADQAFERGAGRLAEVFLPWPGFESGVSVHADEVHDKPRIGAYNIAKNVHPVFDTLKRPARDLHARNCHQVLGWDLRSPTTFVVAWTPDPFPSGGTRTACELARRHGITVFDLGDHDDQQRIRRLL